MRSSVLLAIALVFVACAAGNWANDTKVVSNAQNSQERLAHELEAMSLTANAAALLRSGKSDMALRLLEQRLTASAESAEQYVEAGVRLGPESPNLIDAPRRAAKYAEENNLPDLAARMSTVYDKLK